MKRVLAAFAGIALAAALFSQAHASNAIRTSAQPIATGTANAALSLELFGNETLMGVEITGLTASGATLTIEGSTDGRPNSSPNKVWFSTVAIPFTCPSPSTFTTVSADGPFKLDVSGLTNIRFRVSSTGTGTALISANGIPASTLGSCGGTGGGGGGGTATTPYLQTNAYTPITTGASSATTAITAGGPSVVVAVNAGLTNGAYCAPGATATTSDQYLAPGGGWFAWNPNGASTFACIQSGGATTINVTGGSGGLPTGSGGGGGGSGGVATTPFIPGATSIAPFTATSVNTTTSIPSGATTLIVSSASTTSNFLHCTLGAGPATNSDQTIQPGESFAFNVASATQFSCVTSSGSQVVNAVAGSGALQANGGAAPITGPFGEQLQTASVAVVAKTNAYQSSGTGQYAVAINSPTGLTIPSGSLAAEICVESAQARYTDDGTTPTSTNGIPVNFGGTSSTSQCFAYAGPLAAFQIIGSGATMDVSYYK